jgi:hypothetical protein
MEPGLRLVSRAATLIKDAFHSSITSFRHRTTVLAGVLNSTPQYPQGAAKVSNFFTAIQPVPGSLRASLQ